MVAMAAVMMMGRRRRRQPQLPRASMLYLGGMDGELFVELDVFLAEVGVAEFGFCVLEGAFAGFDAVDFMGEGGDDEFELAEGEVI